MYNGIGLSTPRGSGTNGYVQRNLSHIIEKKKKIEYDRRGQKKREEHTKVRAKSPNKDLLLHEQKRQIEVECLKLQLELEAKGISPDSIDVKVNDLRQSLLTPLNSCLPQDLTTPTSTLKSNPLLLDSHQAAALKEKESLILASALGIDPNAYQSGEAFNPVLQEKKRLAEKEKKAMQRQEKLKQTLEIEEQRKKRVLQVIVQEIKQGKRSAEDLSKAEQELGILWLKEWETTANLTSSSSSSSSFNSTSRYKDRYTRPSRTHSCSTSRSRSRSKSRSRSRSRSKSPPVFSKSSSRHRSESNSPVRSSSRKSYPNEKPTPSHQRRRSPSSSPPSSPSSISSSPSSLQRKSHPRSPSRSYLRGRKRSPSFFPSCSRSRSRSRSYSRLPRQKKYKSNSHSRSRSPSRSISRSRSRSRSYSPLHKRTSTRR